MERDRREAPITAEDQERYHEEDFADALNDVKKLGKCFWRFTAVEPLIKEVCAKVAAVIEKKRRSLMLYVQQVEGQFVMIRERVAE